MSREAKGKLTIIAALLMAVFGASLAGSSLALAQSSGRSAVTVQESAPYIDVRTVPIVEVPEPQPAAAPVTVKGPDDAPGLWGTLRTALKSKNWVLAVAAALALLVLVLRLGAAKLLALLPGSLAKGWAARFLSWCNTDRGGVALVLCSGALTGVVNAVAAGQALSVDLVFDSLNIAAASATGGAGLYVLIKRLAWPRDVDKPSGVG